MIIFINPREFLQKQTLFVKSMCMVEKVDRFTLGARFTFKSFIKQFTFFFNTQYMIKNMLLIHPFYNSNSQDMQHKNIIFCFTICALKQSYNYTDREMHMNFV
jgi:hypothetical protein